MDNFMGSIINTGYTFVQKDYIHCAGQILNISSHQALFSLLGTTYGGDGRSTFAVPDLRTDGRWTPGKPVYQMCLNGTYPSRN
jgi:microcystin-dependent protein